MIADIDISSMLDLLTDSLDIKKIDKANLSSIFLLATQKLPSIIGTVDTRGKLTFYSLYKQANEGDADEVPGNEEVTEPTK